MENRIAATLTYWCLIYSAPKFEAFTSRKEAKDRALYLSKNNLAKEIKIVTHAK